MSQQLPRTMTLGEILDEQQLLDVSTIVDNIKAGSLKPELLRTYLLTQSASLADRGIDSNYLYYSILYSQNLFTQ